MSTMMTSRMKQAFHFQARRVTQDELVTQPPPPQIQPEEPEPRPSLDEQTQRHYASLRAAHDFIYDLINSQDRWSSHMPLIRITCPHTLSELHALGHLPQSEGAAACRKLIRVPVIHEEIALFIWTQLASRACVPTLTNEPTVSAAEAAQMQRAEEAFLAQLDARFRFDKPTSASPRGRRRDSPPTSPKEMPQRNFAGSSSSSEPRQRSRSTQVGKLYRHESIEECDEDLDQIQSKVQEATRETTVGSWGKDLPAIRPDAERQRSVCSIASRSGSHGPSLKWYRRQRAPSTASQASSVTSLRSGSLAGRLGSVVGGFGQRAIGTLSEDSSHGHDFGPNTRNRSARSL